MTRKETADSAARPVFAVFGGTFNPVHEGHVGLARGLLARGGVDRVLVVPAARNPFKEGDDLLPAGLRLAMVERAMAGIAGVCVLDLEVRRGEASYTVETVAALASAYPRAELRLAMGWDVYEQFGEWRCAGAILEQAGLLVILRKGVSQQSPPGGRGRLAGLPEPWRGRLRSRGNGRWGDGTGRTVLEFLNLALPDVSSSQIRQARALEHVPAAARPLLAEYWQAGGAA